MAQSSATVLSKGFRTKPRANLTRLSPVAVWCRPASSAIAAVAPTVRQVVPHFRGAGVIAPGLTLAAARRSIDAKSHYTTVFCRRSASGGGGASPGSSPRTVNVVLFGVTGDGKSTLGNLLVSGQTDQPFKVSEDAASVTQECQHHDVLWTYQNAKHNVRIVDTVGFDDTGLPRDRVMEAFRQYADRVPHGVHAFLFVVQSGRFKSEHANALQAFENVCGKDALRHVALVYTKCGRSKGELAASLESGRNNQLKEVLESVFDWTAIGKLESMSTDKEQERQRAFDLIFDLYKTNDQKPYENAVLQESLQWYEAWSKRVSLLDDFSQTLALMTMSDVYEGRLKRQDAEAKFVKLEESAAELRRREEHLKAARLREAQEKQRAEEAAEAERQARHEFERLQEAAREADAEAKRRAAEYEQSVKEAERKARESEERARVAQAAREKCSERVVQHRQEMKGQYPNGGAAVGLLGGAGLALLGGLAGPWVFLAAAAGSALGYAVQEAS